MKIKIRSLILVAVLADVSACSTIKNLFPDKEKDYQFTTEIPPLVLPPDLAGGSIANVPAAPVAETAGVVPAAPAIETAGVVPAAPAIETAGVVPAAPAIEAAGVVHAAPSTETAYAVPAVPPTETAQAIKRKLTQLELFDSGEGVKRLRIGAPSATAWRMVGKALSRKSIEVTNRNQEEGLFHVQYDPNKQDVEDGSFWDEIVFVFTGFTVTEQEYVIKLVENNQQTDVIIMDKEQKPATDAVSLSLLALLHDTIKADLLGSR